MGNFFLFKLFITKKIHKATYEAMLKDCSQMEAELERKNKLDAERKIDIQRAILEFFIKDRLPLSKMNSEHFNKLLDGL